MEKQKIKQEFRQIGAGSVRFIATRNEVLDFIFNLIDQTKKETREETIKEIEESLPPIIGFEGDDDFINGYDSTLKKVKDILNKLKK